MVRAHADDAGALRQCVCVAPSMPGCTVRLCAFDSVPWGLLMGVLSDVVLPPRTMLHDQLVLLVTSAPPGPSGPSSLSVDVGIPSNGASFRQAAGAHS